MADSIKLKRNVSVLSSQIEEFQCSNDFDTLDEINEVKEYVSEAVLLKQELIEYHTDLKLVVTEQEYEIYKKAYTHELEGLRMARSKENV